ncbi:DUF4380 domain-containing protein [Cellvibrio japonicus]|uniref:DUF4380 domain-containing protein n=1 Tax=Cellvibrio japonicus (strain Ueda107) TaxID=498211 RepID=B3PL34_CELJU|nr:DUF4380 domain-containing protein [Cellvibrio japonicus]ACE82943.1 conserved hypothetical protein [Cellvibrio japonicus Ueda107]
MRTGFLALSLSGLLCSLWFNPCAAQIQRLPLNTSAISVEVTPDIGGRILAIALPGKENFLRQGEAVISEPEPYVAPDADNVGYLAQETWLGPQSQWWTQQLVNPARAQAKAVWPPDPYLILAKNQVVQADKRRVVMRTPASPVSGVVVEKHYALVEGKPDQLHLMARATNIRDTTVAWDIWFNTRVPPSSQVYVPVASQEDVRVEHMENEQRGSLGYRLVDGFFTFVSKAHPDKPGVRGKAFIQPSAGWMAAFREGQVFIIHFPLQPTAVIHPEQGQVELYLDSIPEYPSQGLLEMEVHAPYRKLQPGAHMEAEQTWRLLPYGGADDPAAHIAFLRALNL